MLTSLATRVGSLKHWQVFVPIAAAYVLVGLHQARTMGPHLANPDIPDFEALEALIVENMILSMPIFAALLFWIWSIAYCSIVRARKIMNTAATRAAVALIVAYTYMAAVPWVFPLPSNFNDPLLPLEIVGTLHIAAVFGVVYAFGVAARSLVSAENDSKAVFHEYLGTFFLIWLFPFGVWSVQSRLNSLISRVPSGRNLDA